MISNQNTTQKQKSSDSELYLNLGKVAGQV